MTTTLPASSSSPSRSAVPARALSFNRMLGFVAVTAFIASEIIAATGAGIWALSGLLHSTGAATGVLAVLLGIPALYLILVCARLAYLVETDPAND